MLLCREIEQENVRHAGAIRDERQLMAIRRPLRIEIEAVLSRQHLSGTALNVNYCDAPPWPSGAVDGGGLSLQRRNVSQYGNEPLNWIASDPTRWRSFAGNGSKSPPA